MFSSLQIQPRTEVLEGVPGIKPQVTSNQLLNSPSNLPYMCL